MPQSNREAQKMLEIIDTLYNAVIVLGCIIVAILYFIPPLEK